VSHALFAPSAAERWLECPGSIVLGKDAPRTSNEFSAEGTAAHEIASQAFSLGLNAADFIGETVEVDGFSFVVDENMAEHIQAFLEHVAREPGEHHCEIRVPLSDVLQVADQFGTADRVVLDAENETLQVHDLKYGRGVQVYAKGNPQLMLYAAGAAVEFEKAGKWKHFKLCIHQPRLGHYDEHTIGRHELILFIAEARRAVKLAAAAEACGDPKSFEATYLRPSEKACRWCPVNGSCGAYAKAVADETAAAFDDLTLEESDAPGTAVLMDDARLALALEKVDWVKEWVKAVEAEAHARAMAGIELPGWKLVTGRAGARKWADDEAAEGIMKKARFKIHDMYDMKLISPTKAEKVVGKAKPRTWNKLALLVTQNEGKLHLAPTGDPRPAESVPGATADDFEDVTGGL
jgi:hypothetical protein